MAKELSTIKQLCRLWGHLLPRRKKQLAVLSALMVVTSFAEVLSIGAVLPFLGVLTSPETIFAHPLAQPFLQLLQIQAARDLLLPFSLLFIAAAILAGLTRVILLWIQARLSMAIGTDFSIMVYERTLHQSYSLHVSRNSSEILEGVRKAEGLVYFIIQPVLFVISAAFILLIVIASLLLIQPFIALSVILSVGFIYAAIVVITQHRISMNSQIIAGQQVAATKAIQEGLGGIRDVLLDGTQSVYLKAYKEAFSPIQKALATNQVVGASPRFVVEAFGMVLIAALAYSLTAASGSSGELTGAIPVIGALALAAQRILPLSQQIYHAYINIKGNQASTQDVLVLLDQPIEMHAYLPPTERVEFETSIILRDLSFRYTEQGPWVLRHLNLEIPKGSRIGIIGVTGSGKSTLSDVIMGLLPPTEGALVVDNIVVNQQNIRSWQLNVSHVPQAIYLSDASIMENIAFGVPSELIDVHLVKRVAQQAHIAQTIEGWRNSYHTLVGERGVRLSGGQRQRIGIARALYKRSSVIVFDEATSALDNQSEANVMQALETLGRNVTILLIAHRLTTLRNCDQIVELGSTGIIAVGDYQRMVERAA